VTYTNLPRVRDAGPAGMTRLRAAMDEPVAMLRLAVPIMLIALVNTGMSITDTAMVSVSFGANALAALAVGSDFYSILFYLARARPAGLFPSTPLPSHAPTMRNARDWSGSGRSSSFSFLPLLESGPIELALAA
jgi:hypothetical protein